ncbi:MerR family transcriptional regulator [Agromyces sp. NPDC049794]|uniref:MerR family transcriptional regulator n=1 Tax=unclassified Agromyces TaxID=2639701 RepID=UPI00340D3DA1
MEPAVALAGNRMLRTAQVSSASGYSVQQVRDLERLGVIPPAARGRNGYRAYAPLHVRALAAYRGLAAAVGPVEARRLLARIWRMRLEEAAAELGAVHVRLATERARLLQAQEALRTIRADAADPADPADPNTEAHSVASDAAMTITELSRALGVRSSTLRFWEREGLVAPRRVTSLQIRVYDPSGIRTLRIVAALRGAGYRIPAVREIVAALHDVDARDTTGHVLQQRLDALALRTVALLEAGADLAQVLRSVPPAVTSAR